MVFCIVSGFYPERGDKDAKKIPGYFFRFYHIVYKIVIPSNEIVCYEPQVLFFSGSAIHHYRIILYYCIPGAIASI